MNLFIQDLTYQFQQKNLLHPITLNLQAGRLYGVLGPNGAGKSTFLKTLSGIWPATHGQVFWQQQEILKLNRLEKSRLMTLVPQNPSIYFEFTAFEMITMGRYAHHFNHLPYLPIIESAMRQMDVWHLRERLISQLSGGEKQRVYLARALVTEAPIMLLDEPTAHLDLRHQLDIWILLKQMASQGKLLIAAVHDLVTAKRFCDEFIVLHQGKCVSTGSYQQALSVEHLEMIFGLEKEDRKQLNL